MVSLVEKKSKEEGKAAVAEPVWALHDGDDGFEWRIVKLVHERGALFWLRLLAADSLLRSSRGSGWLAT